MDSAKVYFPSRKLRPFIQCYVFIDIPKDTLTDKEFKGLKIMPGTFTSLVLFFTKPSIKDTGNQCVPLEKFSLSGYNTNPKQFLRDSHLKQMVICFTPIGAQKLIGFPMADITDQHVAVRDIFSNEYDQLINELCEADNYKQRINIFEKFYLQQTALQKPVDERIYPLLAYLFKCRGTKALSDISDKFCISERSLQRLIKNHVGINFKFLSRLIRFRSARLLLKNISSQPVSLTDIAYELKYYDQAHFIHDFRQLSGNTPKEYILAQNTHIHFEKFVD